MYLVLRLNILCICLEVYTSISAFQPTLISKRNKTPKKSKVFDEVHSVAWKDFWSLFFAVNYICFSECLKIFFKQIFTEAILSSFGLINNLHTQRRKRKTMTNIHNHSKLLSWANSNETSIVACYQKKLTSQQLLFFCTP